MKAHLRRNGCLLITNNGRLGNLPKWKNFSAIRDYDAHLSTSSSVIPNIEEWRKQLPKQRVIKSPYPTLEIPNVTYPQFAMSQMEKFGEKIFMINGETGAKHSYHGSLHAITRVASALIRLGLKPEDRVGFYSTNSPEYVLTWFAATAVGAVATDANPAFTSHELAVQLSNTNSKFLVVEPDNAEIGKQAAANLPGFKKVIVLGEAEGCIPYSELVKDSGDLFSGPIDCDPTNTVHLPCSSGTTGLPKAVLRSHRNLVSTAYVTNNTEVRLFEEDSTALILLPLFHMYASFLTGCVLLTGATAVFQKKFIPEQTLTFIQNYKVTHFPLVPPLLLWLVQHPMISKFDLKSLKTVLSGAAPVAPKIFEAAYEKLALTSAGQGYGLTEMCPVSARGRSTGPLAASGMPAPNTEIRVVCLDTGRDLGIDKQGEIWARGPHMMTGYENNPEATNASIVDGWFRTGDIGYVCDQGYVYIVDRLKDFIKVKGHQVAPAELEALLLTHPGVKDVAVIGVLHERYGEAPRAFVVLKDESTTPAELMKFVAERTSPEKHLVGGVVPLEQIPKTASGKILKKDLKNLDSSKTI